MIAKCIFIFAFIARCKSDPNDESSVVNCFCNGQQTSNGCDYKDHALQGLPGKRGAQGVSGQKGEPGNMNPDFLLRLENLEEFVQSLKTKKTLTTDYPRTCADVTEKSRTSGFYLVSPEPNYLNPVAVYCLFNGSKAVTVISHDSKDEARVDSCEEKKCYVRNVNYDIPMSSIRSIVRQSQNCRQKVKYRCHGASLFTGNGVWTTHDNIDVDWTDQKYGATCSCSIDESCANPKHTCNCDSNDLVWRSDEGYITDRTVLPVTKLKFADSGDGGEVGYHTLGALECY